MFLEDEGLKIIKFYNNTITGLRNILSTRGEDFEFERETVKFEVRGIRVNKDQFIRFLPDTVVCVGDLLVSKQTGIELDIIDIDYDLIGEMRVCLKAFYKLPSKTLSDPIRTTIVHIDALNNSILNVDSHLNNTTQSISATPNVLMVKAAKEDLSSLIEELYGVLRLDNLELSEDTVKIKNYVEELFVEIEGLKIDRRNIEFNIENLERDMINLVTIIPAAYPITTKILKRIHELFPR
jgi:hypothetical protein